MSTFHETTIAVRISGPRAGVVAACKRKVEGALSTRLNKLLRLADVKADNVCFETRIAGIRPVTYPAADPQTEPSK